MSKKILKIFLLLIMLVTTLLTGCASQRELNSLVIVMAIGVDKDIDESGNVKLISQVVLPEKIRSSSTSQSGGNSSEKPYCNVESSASNTAEAIREYTHIVCGRMYIAHNQIFVVGKEMAEQGIEPYFDYFVRAEDTRPTTTIAVSATTARDILDVESKNTPLPAIEINKLIEAQAENSQSRKIDIQYYMNTMMSKSTSFIAPLVSVIQQGEKKFVSTKGMAVFKEDKMVGELDEKETRGLLWIKNWITRGSINVDYKNGQVTTSIAGSKSEISPKVQNGKVIINLKVSEEGNLTSQTCTENIAILNNIAEVEQLNKEVIQDEIMSAVNKAKELGTDIFGFGDLLQKYCYDEWQDIKDNWNTVFPTVELKIDIEAKIRSNGAISKPAIPDPGGES